MMMSDSELRPYLERMCQRAQEQPLSPKWFDIEDLLTKDEWHATKGYGHITLGQSFKSLVSTGKVRGVRCCLFQPKGKRNRYERYI